MFSDDEKAEAQTIVRNLFAKLTRRPLDTEALVWHYTRGETAIRILQSGSIYATQAACLNDSTEVRYAAERFREALQIIRKDVRSTDASAAFLDSYVAALTDTEDVPGHAGSMFFVTCFSELEDDLSQWRSYAGGENGYALGVKIGHMFGVPNSLVGRVNYDRDLHKALAKELAEKTVETYTRWRARRHGEELVQWDQEFLAFWDQQTTILAPFVKDPGFEGEREIRIVHPFAVEELDQMVFIQKRTMMSRHLPLLLPSGCAEDKKLFPASRILVGPGRHKHISLVSLNTLLKKHGYPSGICSLSQRPYQET